MLTDYFRLTSKLMPYFIEPEEISEGFELRMYCNLFTARKSQSFLMMIIQVITHSAIVTRLENCGSGARRLHRPQCLIDTYFIVPEGMKTKSVNLDGI